MEKIYTAQDVARILGLTHMRICLMLRRGQLPGKKIGKQWYVPESSLKRALGIGGAPNGSGRVARGEEGSNGNGYVEP